MEKKEEKGGGWSRFDGKKEEGMIFVSQEEGMKIMGIDSGEENRKRRF